MIMVSELADHLRIATSTSITFKLKSAKRFSEETSACKLQIEEAKSSTPNASYLIKSQW